MIVVAGTITGNYAHPVKIVVFDEFHAIIGSQSNVTTDYEIEVQVGGDYMVVLIPNVGKQWRPNFRYLIGQTVIPNNYPLLPYVFVCENSGYSGSTPPDFTTLQFAKIIDDGAEWRLLERIPPSLVQFPVKAILGA